MTFVEGNAMFFALIPNQARCPTLKIDVGTISWANTSYIVPMRAGLRTCRSCIGANGYIKLTSPPIQ